MKFISFIQLILFFLITVTSHSQRQTSLTQALKLAGKQRMLAQRMAKDKVYIRGGINENIAKEELQTSITEFDYGIQYLRDFAPSDDIKHKVDVMEYSFRLYKEVIEANTKESFQDIFKDNTLFLSICTDLVESLINYSKVKNLTITSKNQNYISDQKIKATSASAQLTYLTQRFALYYGFNHFGIKNIPPKNIENIANIIEKKLDYLSTQELNTLEIDDSLSRILHYWNVLKTRLYQNAKIQLNSKKITSKELFDICNDIMLRAKKTTELYSQLGKK